MSFSILIVDDEPGMRLLLKEALVTTNYKVYEAADGLAGLEQSQLLQPDLVLLDIMMPGLDGISVLRELRQKNKKIGILMMSALKTKQVTEEAMTSGADGYLYKPFSLRELFAEIQRVRDQLDSRGAHSS